MVMILSIRPFTESHFSDIADSVRSKRSISDTLTLDEIATQIGLITGGDDFVTSISLTAPTKSTGSVVLSAEISADVLGTPSFYAHLKDATVKFYKYVDGVNDVLVSTNTANSDGIATSDTLTITEDTTYYAKFDIVSPFPSVQSSSKSIEYLSLPYQQVEWISSSGTQYIDTGVYPTQNTKIQMKFMNLSVTGDNIIGNFGTGESNSFRFFNNSSKAYLDYGSGASYNRIYGGTINANTDYEVEIGNRYVKNLVTGSNIISSSSVSFSQKSYTIYINGNRSYTKNKFYYIKIYDNDALVRDYIPCYLFETGEIGLWDLVNDEFYGNDGTGTFEKGSDVND